MSSTCKRFRGAGAAAVGLSLMFLAPLARAAGAKYEKSEVQVVGTQTALTKPAEASTAKPKEKARPTLHAEAFNGIDAVKAASINAQEIPKYQELIDNEEDDNPEKPDLMFRLAEVMFEQERYFEAQTRQLDEPIFDAQEPKKSRLLQKQKDFEAQEHQWLLQAVKEYLAIAQNQAFQSYKDMDTVLFYLGFTLDQVGKKDAAREFYKRLIKDYPQSRHLPSAYLSFGEFYFDDGDMGAALKFYDRVLQYPDSEVYGYAMYKEAWAYYNQGDPTKSLETFANVVRVADSSNKASAAELSKEAKKDLVLPYSKVGTPDKAYRFFQKVGGEYAFKMLEDLAETYGDEGQFPQSIDIYRQLLSLQPDDPKICSWEGAIVRSTITLHGEKNTERQFVIDELNRLGDTYERLQKIAGVKPDVLEDCRTDTQESLRELATTWHQEAQKTKNPDTYVMAQNLYKEYLERFPEAEDHYQMSYWYSDLLWKVAEDEKDPKKQEQAWLTAGDQYAAVIKEQPKGKFLKDAAYARVLAMKNALDIDDTITEQSQPKVTPADVNGDKGKQAKEEKTPACQPIPPNQQKLMSAFDDYLQVVPDAPERVKIEYHKARIYWEHYCYKDAEPGFQDIVTNHSDSDIGVYAANLLLDCYAQTHDYASFNDWVDKMLADDNLTKDQEFADQLKVYKKNAERLAAQELEKQSEWKLCGVAYRNLADKYPDAKDINELLYNSAVCFSKSHLIGQAIQARLRLIQLLPNDPLSEKALYDVGEDFRAIAFYEQAADYYEKFVKQFSGEKEAWMALSNATVFRRGLGEDDQAIADSQLFIKDAPQWKKEQRAAEVFFSLGTIYEKNHDEDKIQKHYKQYLAEWGEKGGVDRAIEAHIKLAEILWRDSCPVGEGVYGACIKVERVRSGGRAGKKKVSTQCGPETKSKITVFDRKKEFSVDALAHWKAAVELARGKTAASIPAESDEERTARWNLMMNNVAEASFVLLEPDFEKYLAMPFPQNLDFNPEHKKAFKKSQETFIKWLGDKEKLAGSLADGYGKILKTGNSAQSWAIASAARIGQLFENFADALYTASVPPLPKQYQGLVDPEDWRDTYCDKLEDKASPQEAKAEGLFTACLVTSTRLSWFNQWSKMCEGELNQLDPSKFPLAAELRAKPGFVSEQRDVGPAITEISQQ